MRGGVEMVRAEKRSFRILFIHPSMAVWVPQPIFCDGGLVAEREQSLELGGRGSEEKVQGRRNV